MSSPNDQISKGQGPSVLPSFRRGTDLSIATLGEDPQAEYDKADKRLHKLEEELDVVLGCAEVLRTQREALVLETLKGQVSTWRTQPLSPGWAQPIDQLIALVGKSKAIDEMIKELKEECAVSRSECDFFRSKMRTRKDRFKQAFTNHDSLARGVPESGFPDGQAIAERIVTADTTATSVSGVVGAFGAGITYTTIFTAARGRLDLISWAFACFLIVVINSTGLQVISLPRHAQIAKILRQEYSASVEARLMKYMLLVGGPLIMGFLLLGVSVAVVTPGVLHPFPGTPNAVKAAGYVPIVAIGYYVASALVVGLLAIVKRLLPHLIPKVTGVPEKDQYHFHSLLAPLKEKLYFLPGGPGYDEYRKLRRKELENLNNPQRT